MAKQSASFLTGAMVGVAMGVAASIFLNSKKGKELRDDIGGRIGDFYKYISPKIKKLGKLGKKEYEAFMEDAVKKYSKAKKLSEETAKELMQEMQNSWRHFSKHISD